MKNWMTCREAARLWNVTERWVSGLCSSGKLVGAVTHVLIDDRTTGYGIFAENMLKTAESVTDNAELKKAS